MPRTKSKIEHVWSVLVSGTSVDQETNNLSLFNIIEQVNVPKNQLITIKTVKGEDKPAIPVGFTLVSLWRKAAAEDVALKGDVEVEFLDPSGKMRQKGEYPLNLPEKTKRLRSRMMWGPIRVIDSGTYRFAISLKEEGRKTFRKVGETQLDIQLLEDESPPQKIEPKSDLK